MGEAMRVFISAPYSQGDEAANVRAAIDASEQVRAAGHSPLCPHLSHFWHIIYPHNWEEWLRIDLDWLKVADIMVRLPGESKGADLEEAKAQELDIPVYHGVEVLLACGRADQR